MYDSFFTARQSWPILRISFQQKLNEKRFSTSIFFYCAAFFIVYHCFSKLQGIDEDTYVMFNFERGWVRNIIVKCFSNIFFKTPSQVVGFKKMTNFDILGANIFDFFKVT